MRRAFQVRAEPSASGHGPERRRKCIAARRTDERHRREHAPRTGRRPEAFAGCAVVISHDRWFLDRICTHILAFEGDGNVFFFEGGYSDYESNKMKRLGLEEPKRIRYRKLMED